MKNGKNYRFKNDTITMYVQFNSDDSLKALTLVVDRTTEVVKEIYSQFSGKLSFPNLDGYTEVESE